MIYDGVLGSFVGSRGTKFCRGCLIYEHYGYWSKEGKKHYDLQALDNPYLLSTEDSAFSSDLMKEVSSFLIVGAVAFSTFAASFNRRFGLLNESTSDEDEARKPKRY